MTAFLSKSLGNDFKECHHGESDYMLFGKKISFKKIYGKSNIALDWSKNSSEETSKERFLGTPAEALAPIENIMIMNLKSEKWWKKRPPKHCKQKN